MQAKIFASQPAQPGTAQLMVRLRNEQAILSSLTFTLCNNEQNYLQPDGSWSPAPHWFTIEGGYPLNTGSGFPIGPTLLDPLLEHTSQVLIQAKLSSGEIRRTTLQLVRDELFSSNARGQTGDYIGSSVLSTPSPEPVVTTEPAVQPEAAPLPPIAAADERKPKSRSSRVPMIIATLLVLLIAIAALWWFLGQKSVDDISVTAEKQPETPAAITPPAEPAAPAEPATPAEPVALAAPAVSASACTTANLNSQSELDFVQSCVQQKLDNQQLLAIIQAAKDAHKCGVAQRLYANRAQGGDSQIALAYAGEYDPKYHQASECFKDPDADTAVYWYETALQSDPDNQTAKQRLEELGK
ncbi:hypothetical protein [Klebsiella sp. BIGb0407]|uniref:hypothetical protein n=1 Tax=Klebsiella sp. BIGb0407 TaxID=2940603 RepID=UPI002168D7F1|nr:hypothetical protein [Klebsiella sp. BIGb0407]MCS3431092.1 flagellar basal body-associated protein FliL [Klebsiella sp. BIGb0407]